MAQETATIPIDVAESTVLHDGVGKVLKSASFRFLWFSQILSQVAGHMLNFALVIKIFQLTGSNAMVSILVALVSIPPVLFASLAGIYADNFNRKYILLFSNVVRALLVVAFVYFGSFPILILILAFGVSTISQFFGPSESSSIASLVPRRGYFSANSLFVFTTYTSFLLGYSLAGPILEFLGEHRTYILLVTAFTLAAIMNLLLPPIRDHLERQQGRSYFERAFGSLRRDFQEGLRFIRGHRLVLLVVLQISIVFGFERSIVALLPDLAQNVFGLSVDEIGYYLITPAGIGAFIGALIANHLKRRFRKTTIILLGMFIASLGLLLLPFYQHIEAVVDGQVDVVLFNALIAFLSGLGDVFVIIAAQTLLQELTPNETRGRVFGSLITLMNLVGLPLILLVGFLANTLSITAIIFAIGVILTALVLTNLLFFRATLAQEPRS